MTAIQQWWMGSLNNGLPPGLVFIEDWEHGFTSYTTVGPESPGCWSLVSGEYGAQTMQYFGHTTVLGVNYLTRTPEPVPLFFNRLEFKFRLLTAGNDDACLLQLKDGASSVLFFNPRREVSYDGTRRPEFRFHLGIYLIGDTAVDIGVWYKVKLIVAEGDSNTHMVLTDLSTDLVVSDTYISGNHGTGFTFDTLSFNDDATIGSSTTEYDDIYCYNE